MRNVLTTLLEVCGFALITASAFTVDLGLGLLAAGVSCLCIGILAGR